MTEPHCRNCRTNLSGAEWADHPGDGVVYCPWCMSWLEERGIIYLEVEAEVQQDVRSEEQKQEG